MKKVFALMMACVIALSTPMSKVYAEEGGDVPHHQLYSNKREKVLLARELGINPNQIRNIRKKTFNSTSTNKLAHIESIDMAGNIEINPVDIEITEVRISGNSDFSQELSAGYCHQSKYMLLKASETKKTEKSKKGLEGYIKWIDNFGPENELTAVHGYADPKKYGPICKYSYGVGGMAGSIVTKKNTGFYVDKSKIGLKGLSFSFDFTTKKTDRFKAKSLIITTAFSY